MFRLSDGEEIMTLAFFVLIQYRSVTDGQTDGHLCFGYTSACIACYATCTAQKSEKAKVFSKFSVTTNYSVNSVL